MSALELVRKYKRDREYKTLLFYTGPFSQWWRSSFVLDGFKYNCAEQYMMASKARMFGDFEAAAEIMACVGDETIQGEFIKHPRAQQKIGRRVKNFNNEQWSRVCKDFVLRGNLAKFSQNNNLLAALADTNGFILVEASPYDRIWGIGLGENELDAFEPHRWNGTNWLGDVLMETREYLTT